MTETISLTSAIILPTTPAGPLQVTARALDKLASALKSDPELTEKHFIRVSVKGGGCAGYVNTLDFDDELDPDEDFKYDLKSGDNPISLVVDTFSALYLEGTELDYVSEGFEEGFKFKGGQQKKSCACGSSVAY